MPDAALNILFDQNIPGAATQWLRSQRPRWNVYHVKELGFAGREDAFLYKWAQENRAVVVTFDEAFADARLCPLGSHQGVVRLRAWPTTTETTRLAPERLLRAVPEGHIPGSLIIIDNLKTRLRRA